MDRKGAETSSFLETFQNSFQPKRHCLFLFNFILDFAILEIIMVKHLVDWVATMTKVTLLKWVFQIWRFFKEYMCALFFLNQKENELASYC